jgi:MIP family channel proteins
MEEREPAAYAAELIGTFMLVFFICMVLSVDHGLGYADFAVIGLLHAFVLMMLVYTLGNVSGAHFNPAVTTALAAMRKISPGNAVVYILLQLSGGIAGALVCKLLVIHQGRAIDYGATTISKAFLNGHVAPALLAEALGTFALMWAIMGVAVNPKGDKTVAGLVIGATLGFAVMVFGPLTGAGFNPARSFGPAIVSGKWTDFWVYVLAPVVGALVAAFVYRAVAIREE